MKKPALITNSTFRAKIAPQLSKMKVGKRPGHSHWGDSGVGSRLSDQYVPVHQDAG